MKILAICCGRKNGNSVKMARVALKAAKDAGHQVQLVNLMDLSIKPCIDCKACVIRLNRPDFTGSCPLHDDMAWLDEQYLACDGVLYVAPMYENSAPAPYKTMCDRLGPSHDITFQRFAYENQMARDGKSDIDQRFFRTRPVVYIGHGGSEWNYLSYPTLAIPSIPLGLQVVDYVSIPWSDGWMNDGRLERIRDAGQRLAAAVGQSPEERQYAGDPGICPVCHNRVMHLGDTADSVTCALCGVTGTLSVEEGRLRVHFSPETLALSHILEAGRAQHMKDLQENGRKRAGADNTAADALAKALAEEIPLTKPE